MPDLIGEKRERKGQIWINYPNQQLAFFILIGAFKSEAVSATEANQKCGVALNLEQVGLIVFFFSSSSPAVILEKQGRGREYGSLSDAGGEELPPPPII